MANKDKAIVAFGCPGCGGTGTTPGGDACACAGELTAIATAIREGLGDLAAVFDCGDGGTVPTLPAVIITDNGDGTFTSADGTDVSAATTLVEAIALVTAAYPDGVNVFTCCVPPPPVPVNIETIVNASGDTVYVLDGVEYTTPEAAVAAAQVANSGNAEVTITSPVVIQAELTQAELDAADGDMDAAIAAIQAANPNSKICVTIDTDCFDGLVTADGCELIVNKPHKSISTYGLWNIGIDASGAAGGLALVASGYQLVVNNRNCYDVIGTIFADLHIELEPQTADADMAFYLFMNANGGVPNQLAHGVSRKATDDTYQTGDDFNPPKIRTFPPGITTINFFASRIAGAGITDDDIWRFYDAEITVTDGGMA